jgi:squalene-hopene/tetraprenyl-beta-curcumene cyclase
MQQLNRALERFEDDDVAVAPVAERTPLHSVDDGDATTTIEANVETAVIRARDALLAVQRDDGHWVFELEADATIPAEYVLLQHYLGQPADATLEERIGVYLRRMQLPAGGWPLLVDGTFNISASVKAYFALKAIGDDVSAPHMRVARAAILANGGAENANVFTRILLALFGVLPWSAVPVIPVEVMLLPKISPFHLSRISYWGRTVLVPLLVLQALKPRARNPRGVTIDELFVKPPETVGRPSRAEHQSRGWYSLFAAIDAALRVVEPAFPDVLRRRAIDKAVAFVKERLNGESGLGAIYPAMANTVMMFDALGYAPDDPDVVTARRAIDKLLIVGETEAYCQPCVSPVWDTALASHALLEVGGRAATQSVERGLGWLIDRQELNVVGDWAVQRPDVRPGGWAFQYDNPHYPDLDDTAAVVLAMHRHARLQGEPTDRFDEAIERAVEWTVGLQSANGGWGAFDADNTNEYLNNIPFADHGALLDPPTEDVTARCVGMLAQLGRVGHDAVHRESMARGLEFLRRTQRSDGSWYGRWGMNFLYGTWSVLCGLKAAGIPADASEIRRAVTWLRSTQNPDGGWGEDGISYELQNEAFVAGPSTASQTAWALLGLMAAGETEHATVERGIDWLVRAQGADGFWNEPRFTATGFPRVFYLRYHGYSKFFPLWALARYRRHLGGLAPIPRLGL